MLAQCVSGSVIDIDLCYLNRSQFLTVKGTGQSFVHRLRYEVASVIQRQPIQNLTHFPHPDPECHGQPRT